MAILKREGGFTLIEVMMSMIVLAVGIFGLAILTSMAIFGNSFSKDLTAVNAVAQREMEELLNLANYGSLPYSVVQDSVSGIYHVASSVDDNSSNSSVPMGLYRIGVVVSWNDQEGLKRDVSYSTYKPVN